MPVYHFTDTARLAIDTRSYVGSWLPLGDANVERFGEYLGVTIAGKTYASRQQKTPSGAMGGYVLAKKILVARRDLVS